jgi:hypothetical protein
MSRCQYLSRTSFVFLAICEREKNELDLLMDKKAMIHPSKDPTRCSRGVLAEKLKAPPVGHTRPVVFQDHQQIKIAT